MNTVTIRRAAVADAHVLSLVGSATFLESFADVLPGEHIALHCSRAHSVKAYASDLRSGAHAWLACLRTTGTAVGYAMNSAPDLPIQTSPGDVELKRIYLLSKFHGRGIGKALMQSSIDQARGAGANRLLLGVYHDNRQAIGFYHALGFKTVGSRQFQVGEGTYDDLVLALDLRD